MQTHRLTAALLLAALGGCAPLAETSVKPGINDTFLDPNLRVERLVQRFESHGREVYDHRREIADAVGLQPGQAVADIGAGTGIFMELFAERVGPAGVVYAVDLAPKLVQHLRARAAERGLTQVEARLCTERSAELPAGSIDVAFICDTYHHFEYPRATMASLHRALRPGGEVVIVDFERIPGVTRQWLLDHVRAGKEEVIAEMASFGFERIEEVAIDGLKENYLVRFRRR